MAHARLLSEAEHEAISAAIRAAEEKTAGEIYVVVGEVQDPAVAATLLWPLAAAFILAWLLNLLTPLSTTWVLAAQAAIFIAVAILVTLLPQRHLVIPAWLKAEAAQRMARNLFLSHGIHLTEARTGVLLFVSPLDRRIELVADSGIHDRVPAGTWDEIVGQIRIRARENNLGEGIAGAVKTLGTLLAAHFPPASQDRNELPDRVIEL